MVQLVENEFGLYTVPTTGKTIPVRLFTWENSNHVSVQVITYGATITSIKVPNKNGVIQDIITGFDDLKGFQKKENPYFGATIGRMANRVGYGQLPLNGTIINVTKNIGENQLHGGLIGFDKSIFGEYDNGSGKKVTVKQFTWKNKNNVSIQVFDYGATIRTINLPGKDGKLADIITGFDNFQEYLSTSNRFFGATVGRVANRINKGQASIGSNNYSFGLNNNGKHHLHGGFKGFDKVIWQAFVEGTKLILSYHSADGEEGYPGDLVVHTSFELTESNEFLVDFKATTTKPTFINMTNHSYFNLAGHEKGAEELYKHEISINADHTTDVDADSIPTGKLNSVAGTVFDLRIPKTLGDVIHKVPNKDGFDHNFCITKGEKQGDTFIARAVHPESGRVMEIYSNQPGVQFYTSNAIPDNPANFKGDKSKLVSLQGKGGANYYKHAAFCLETQVWPDAPNHKNFPSALLNPGQTYHHTVAYKFSINN